MQPATEVMGVLAVVIAAAVAFMAKGGATGASKTNESETIKGGDASVDTQRFSDVILRVALHHQLRASPSEMMQPVHQLDEPARQY